MSAVQNNDEGVESENLPVTFNRDQLSNALNGALNVAVNIAAAAKNRDKSKSAAASGSSPARQGRRQRGGVRVGASVDLQVLCTTSSVAKGPSSCNQLCTTSSVVEGPGSCKAYINNINNIHAEWASVSCWRGCLAPSLALSTIGLLPVSSQASTWSSP